MSAGIYGFNSALVGIATLFFFSPGAVSIGLLVVGCVVGGARDLADAPVRAVSDVHRAVHRHDLGLVFSWGWPWVPPRSSRVGRRSRPASSAAVAHGVGQVMFQASIWTALLFLVGIAINDWQHASGWCVASIVGMLVGIYHRRTTSTRSCRESPRTSLGLYGYNATLAAVALFLWRRSLIPPLLGILLSVPLTELLRCSGSGFDRAVRPGDLAGPGARLARWEVIPTSRRRRAS